MTVLDELDKLRASLPGCTLAAFGDLDARIVLCASTVDKRPQEELDALCKAAALCLDGPAASGLAAHLGGEKLGQAIAVFPGEVRVFLRSDVDASDGLFCTFTDQAGVKDMALAGRTTLHKISALQ